MEWSDVEARIEAGENRHTEFKRMLEFRQVGRAICGFANSTIRKILGLSISANICCCRIRSTSTPSLRSKYRTTA